MSAGDLARRLWVACRAVARVGLTHAYRHCSARVDARTFLVSPARPRALVSEHDAPVGATIEAPLPEGRRGCRRSKRGESRRAMNLEVRPCTR